MVLGRQAPPWWAEMWVRRLRETEGSRLAIMRAAPNLPAMGAMRRRCVAQRDRGDARHVLCLLQMGIEAAEGVIVLVAFLHGADDALHPLGRRGGPSCRWIAGRWSFRLAGKWCC